MSSVLPNILITGTPGTGKSTLAQELQSALGLNLIEVSQYAKDNGFIEEYDAKLDTMVLDEDSLLDEMEDQMSKGGNIVDYHSSELFPERWFQIVFVLRCDTEKLHKRLTDRNYNEEKVTSNIQCEIFQVLLDEARESYKEEIVHQLISNTPEDMEDNLEKITSWWRQNTSPTA